MSFQFVSKSVTLNDLEQRNGRYFALFQRIRVASGAHCVKIHVRYLILISWWVLVLFFSVQIGFPYTSGPQPHIGNWSSIGYCFSCALGLWLRFVRGKSRGFALKKKQSHHKHDCEPACTLCTEIQRKQETRESLYRLCWFAKEKRQRNTNWKIGPYGQLGGRGSPTIWNRQLVYHKPTEYWR